MLYLDCDTAVQGNISGILDFLKFGKDYYAYVCPDACGYEGEMVSGVMLMDLERIRKDGFLERARDNIHHNVYQYPEKEGADMQGNTPYRKNLDLNTMGYLPGCIQRIILVKAAQLG